MYCLWLECRSFQMYFTYWGQSAQYWVVITNQRVSRPKESHLQALSEPGVNLSAHRPPMVPVGGTKPARQWGTISVCVFISESHHAVFNRLDATVGYCHAVSVTCQVFQYVFRIPASSKRWSSSLLWFWYMFRFFIGGTPFVLQLLHCRLHIKYATGQNLMAH